MTVRRQALPKICDHSLYRAVAKVDQHIPTDHDIEMTEGPELFVVDQIDTPLTVALLELSAAFAKAQLAEAQREVDTDAKVWNDSTVQMVKTHRPERIRNAETMWILREMEYGVCGNPCIVRSCPRFLLVRLAR